MVGKSLLFKQIKTDRKIFQQISDQIRELVLSGTLKSGDKLPSEKQLATQFNTGRMVVREALRTLEQAGFIYIKQGSKGGAFIKDVDSTVVTRSMSDMLRLGNVTLLDLTEARLSIEKIILKFVVRRINHEDLFLLRKNIEDSEKLISKGMRPGDIYLKFHLLLARSSKNPVFELILEPIMSIVSSYLKQVKPLQEYSYRVLNSHKEIFKAIEERNLTIAEEKMEKHIRDVKRQLMSSPGKKPDAVASGLVREFPVPGMRKYP